MPGTTTCADLTDLAQPRFGGIWLGYGFTMARATILAAPRATRALGMCGTPAADGGVGGRG